MGRTYEETGLVRAHAKWVRTSARKARVVLEHVRGLPVADARVQLRFATRACGATTSCACSTRPSRTPVNNHGLDEDSLVVAEAFADEGVTMKRWQPRARGRAMRIRKRTAHITILLRSVEPAEAAEASKPKRRGRKAAAPEAAQPAPATGRRRAKKAAEAAPSRRHGGTAAPRPRWPKTTAAPRPRRPRPLRPRPRPRWPSRRRRWPRRPLRRRPRPRRAEPEAAEPAAEEKPKPKRTRRKKSDDSEPEGEEA